MLNPKPQLNSPHLLRIGALLVCVVGVLVATSIHGLGYNTDSFSYLQGAQSLAEEGLLTPEYSLVHFPPLLSALLVGITRPGLVLTLSMLLLLLNMALLLLLLHEADVRPGLQAGVVLALGLSPVMLILHGVLHSEPLFLVLLQLALLLLSRGRFGWALLVVALAPLQRYAGLSLVAVAALYVLLHGGWRSRAAWGRALGFGLISVLPVALWLLRNSLVSESPGREVGFRWMGWERLLQAAQNLAPWLLPIVAVGLLLFFITRQRPQMPQIVKISALFIVIYAVFLLVSINFFDHFTPLDFRILSPVILLGWVLAAWFVDEQLKLLRRRALYAWALGAVGLLLLAYALLGLGYAFLQRERGLGMIRALRPVHHEVLRVIPPETLIYSNQEHLISLMGRQAISPPANLYTPDDDEAYYAGMALMIEAVEAGAAVILWFEDFDRPQLARPDELAQMLSYYERHEGLIVFTDGPLLP